MAGAELVPVEAMPGPVVTGLAVRFWGDVPNPEGLPATWPAECRELYDGAGAPPGYVAMTLEDFEVYKAVHRADYDTWRAGIEKQAAPVSPLEVAAVLDAVPLPAGDSDTDALAFAKALLAEVRALRESKAAEAAKEGG